MSNYETPPAKKYNRGYFGFTSFGLLTDISPFPGGCLITIKTLRVSKESTITSFNNIIFTGSVSKIIIRDYKLGMSIFVTGEVLNGELIGRVIQRSSDAN